MESAERIIKKLKSEHHLKGEVSQRLLDQIESALQLIESAEAAMLEDSERERLGATGPFKTPYGFTLDRFGYIKEHPGVKVRKMASDELRACLKQLNLDSEKGEEKKETTSGLGKIIALKNKQA